MKRRIVFDVCVLIFVNYFLTGCRSIPSHAATSANALEIVSPSPAGAISPRVTAMRDGSVLLTWLEPAASDGLAALRASFWRNGSWSAPATIADPRPFSRHPSESPGIVALSKNNLIAYWSQKPPNEKIPTQEVDVYFSVSTDRGLHWTLPTLANEPGTGEESSYPSAAPIDDNHGALIWLDGANWTKEKHVRLMSRTVQSDGSATEAGVIDPDTCTCCPTSVAQTDTGSVAAYRGHTQENIRDIAVVQNKKGRWSRAHIPHADLWHFAGCPVNGPHLDAAGARIAMIWFSAAEDQPKVQLAFSEDGGSTFTPRLRVDEGNVVGRAQVVLLAGHSALAFWLESKLGTMRLVGRRIRDEDRLDAVFEVAHGAGLGYPHVTRAGNQVFITWATETKPSQVHVAVLEAK